MNAKFLMAVMGIFLSATVLAIDPPGTGELMSMQDMDINGNGNISTEEASSNPEMMRRWNSIDTDHDGELNDSEFSSFQEELDAVRKTTGPGRTTNPESEDSHN